MDIVNSKKDAITLFLKTSPSSIKSKRLIDNKEDDQQYEYNKETYLVLTDEEADVVLRAKLLGKLWKFSTSFLMKYIDSRIHYAMISSIQSFGPESGPTLRKIIGESKYGQLIHDVCSNADSGRGLFIATADEKEIRIGKYYIYRLS